MNNTALSNSSISNWFLCISYCFVNFFCILLFSFMHFFVFSNFYFSEFEFDWFWAWKHLTNDLNSRISSVLEQLMILAFSMWFVHIHMGNADFGWVLGRHAIMKCHMTSHPVAWFSQTWSQKMQKTSKKKSWKGATWYATVARQRKILYGGGGGGGESIRPPPPS